jgi:DNA-binding NarL/FixJ family response regulator
MSTANVTEDALDEALIEAVVSTMRTFDEHLKLYVARRLAHSKVTTGIQFQLSPREREVFRLILDGLANKEIATRLGISVRTAKFHVSAILRKCGVSSRLDLLSRRSESPAHENLPPFA